MYMSTTSYPLQPRQYTMSVDSLGAEFKAIELSREMMAGTGRGAGSGARWEEERSNQRLQLNPSLIDLIFLMSRSAYCIDTTPHRSLRDMCVARDRFILLILNVRSVATGGRVRGKGVIKIGRGRELVDGVKGSTSIGCLLFSFPLLAPLRISPRRPIGIQLHV